MWLGSARNAAVPAAAPAVMDSYEVLGPSLTGFRSPQYYFDLESVDEVTAFRVPLGNPRPAWPPRPGASQVHDHKGAEHRG